MIVFNNKIEMVPHPLAPLVDTFEPNQLYDEAVRIVATQQDFTQWSDDDAEIVREVALCNLFFFEKYIAGFSGPYQNLKADVHMEMCNWRQQCMTPGTRAAGFVPRATYKSTVWTHGAIAWELLRDPNIRIGIFSNILDRAQEFMHSVQRTFDSNDLTRALFPDHCPVRGPRTRNVRWNDTVAIMPNRTRNYPEPSLKAHTAGGSTQGIHVDLAVFDDIVGDSQLNAARQATADMVHISNWFASSLRTLLISQRESRVIVVATRYSIDDPYEAIMDNSRTHDGDWSVLEAYYPKPSSGGRWKTYYRSALVDGESIFPESYDEETLMAMSKEDPWTYITQYVNNPHAAGSLDFSSYHVNGAKLYWDTEGTKHTLVYTREGRRVEVLLRDCDIVAAVDPAASEKRATAATSRSALAVIARTPEDDIIILDTYRDYVKTTKMLDWMFSIAIKYRGMLRQMRLEAQGPFNALVDVVKEEMKRRGDYFYFYPVKAMGEKISTIKMMWEPFLKRNAFYVIEESMANVRLEFDIFPSSALDLMDAIKLAIAGTYLPSDIIHDNNDDSEDEETDRFSKRQVGAAGY